MIVTVIRDAADVTALRQSGLRTMPALSVDAGFDAAARTNVDLLVCDLRLTSGIDGRLIDRLRSSSLPCPLLLRHDISRETIATLYGLADCVGDIRTSFRPYDDLPARIRSATRSNDANATPTILRELSRVPDTRARDFIGTMTILGERPVMQTEVANALGLSRSSFRKWLADRRAEWTDLPRFPRLNAVFVALHLTWRRERLAWTAKRAAAAAGFDDEKSCSNYTRYHLGKTSAQLLRRGGFDGLMTAARQMFTARIGPRSHEAIRRI